VRVALRFSIPVFAEPNSRATAHVQWHLERAGGQLVLVSLNDGVRHESIRNIAPHTANGATLKTEGSSSPYVLPGATQRWRIGTAGQQTGAVGQMRLTALADSGNIDMQVNVMP